MNYRLPNGRDVERATRWIRRSLRPRWAKALLSVVVILVIVRLALPSVVKWVINDRLANLDGYYGHVEDVDIALWRGAYQLDALNIMKVGGDVPVPFFSVDETDISIDWWAVLEGQIVAEITMQHPVLNFVSEVSGGEGQMGEGNDWRDVVDDLVPITINRFETHDGEITYRDYQSHPPVDLRLTETEIVAEGLSTARDESASDEDELPARLDMYATAQRSGHVEIHMGLDAFDERPTFDLDLALEDLRAQELNDMLRAYAGVDAEGGRVFLYSELSSRHGRFEGYVKPMAEGLSIFQFGEDGDFIDVFGDFLVSLVAEIFENHGTDRFALRVPVSGTFEAVEVDGWAVVGSVLYNTFIEAIQHGVENRGGWRREPPRERHASR